MTEQALILAGGLGTRLGDITRDLPKPMVPVGDKPFLEWLLDHLGSYGIKNFVLCVGHRADKIQEYFADGSAWGYKIQYSFEKELLGTGGAIKQARGLLHDRFFVVSGDNYLTLDYRDFDDRFDASRFIGLLACWRNSPPLFRSNVKLSEDRRIIEAYDYINPAGKDYVDSGIKLFSKALFDYFESDVKFSLEVDVLAKIAAEGGLQAYPIAEPPLDVGTPDGLANVREKLLRTSRRTHVS
ncbi:MAG: sugar phosphate nucleotidyltransferase [Candidatus Omnitrophota bacterium]|nr:sugar phosphate nucleotidyltransferase [Candidatus Omnitrophota bacterium]